MRVHRPAGEELNLEDPMPFVAANHVSHAELPWLPDFDELDAMKREHQEKLARKRPAGFNAVWPEDQPQLRVVS